MTPSPDAAAQLLSAADLLDEAGHPAHAAAVRHHARKLRALVVGQTDEEYEQVRLDKAAQGV